MIAHGAELAKIIDDVLFKTWSEKLHIIAHSQGGVDSRYVMSALGYDKYIASLITVATPHLGTPLADYVLNVPDGAFDPVSRTMGWIIGRLDVEEQEREGEAKGRAGPRLDGLDGPAGQTRRPGWTLFRAIFACEFTS